MLKIEKQAKAIKITEVKESNYKGQFIVERWRTPRGLGADDGNRTRVASLEDWGSTIELHPRSVGESSSFLSESPARRCEEPGIKRRSCSR